MEAFRGDDVANPLRLSRLYTSAKRSYRDAIPTLDADDTPELASLNRKFRMQKDRLIAWGLEWSDGDSVASDRPIGETIERAGLTEVVSSVMENIIQMVDEVEKMRIRSVPATGPEAYPVEKAVVWNPSNMSRYEDLVRDMTSSIDLLCDLSRSRRSDQPIEKPKQSPETPAYPDEKRRLKKQLAAFDAANESRPGWIPFNSNMPAARKLDQSNLILPEEAPPPYDSFGAACPVRFVASLRSPAYLDNKMDDPVKSVLVEYARFDGIYQSSNIPLPYTRLEELSRILSEQAQGRPQPLLNLVGYFEDTSRPRIGLVYDLPDWFRSEMIASRRSDPSIKPISLFSQLQASSKSQPTASNPITVPALEDRFVLASEVVSSFAHLIDHDFTHRDINSSSVTFFPRLDADEQTRPAIGGDQYLVRKPILCSFDLFSEFDIDASPESINQNIYRHPDDPRLKGPSSNAVHHPRFDVYSLGLVLLEIGLWVPLSDIFKDKYSLKDFKLRLEKIWIPRLASKCGSAYMRAAHECLVAGNDAQASTNKLRQVIRNVRAKLQRCCMLDEDEDENVQDEQQHSIAEDSSERIQAPVRDNSLPASSVEKSALAALTVPRGAHPPVPIYPEFELSKNGAKVCPRKRRAGQPVRYLFPHVQWPQPVAQEYVHLARRLCKIGERVLDPRESADISMDGFGEDEQSARPTFCIMCSSTRKFAKAVKKHLDLEKTNFDFIFFQGSVVRSQAARKSIRSDVRRAAASDIPAKNPHHYPRPLCGASIGAWKNYEHLPPVSFGGVVLIDGQPYGMSVHHMLEAPDDGDDQVDEVQATGTFGDDAVARSSAHNMDYSETFDDDMSDAFSFTASDDGESDLFSELDLSDNEDEQEGNFLQPTSRSLVGDDGDTEGVQPGAGRVIAVTQPALADVAADFFPVDEDRDDDHLDSHTLGHVHASSGLRRLTHGGAEHEVDWALLKLDATRLEARNVVAGGRRFCATDRPGARTSLGRPADLYPVCVARADALAGLDVHCAGRTSGLAAGRIGQFMEFVKMAGRRSWSESWTVTPTAAEAAGAKLGLPGDSGAWVIDNDEGRVCGHVLAWSERKQCAYIAPMEVMLEDIKETLGAGAVCLPGQADALPLPVQRTADGSQNRLHMTGYVATSAPSPTAICPTGSLYLLPRLLTALPCSSKPRLADADSGLDMSADIGDLTLDRSARSPSASSSTSRLYAQHMLLSGSPDHMEREWSARRTALGLQASG